MKEFYRIALAGNPNCGKTCIFNALTGARQHVGNYPGVTVESKSGSFVLNGVKIELIDLHGVYSLSSSSPEEDVVFQELTKPGIDLIVNVVDSTIPRRSLYLTTQLAEFVRKSTVEPPMERITLLMMPRVPNIFVTIPPIMIQLRKCGRYISV